MLLHDPWVDRVLDGVGNVADLTYADLVKMRFRNRHGVTRDNEYVPTLRETLELIERYNGLIHLDIKAPGIDRQVHELLVELNLLPNVVTVNAANSQHVRADSRIKTLPSQGSLIHGRNDYDAGAVRELASRRPAGTLLVDDARCAAATLNRQAPGHITEVAVRQLNAKKVRKPDGQRVNTDPTQLIAQLKRLAPVQQFNANENTNEIVDENRMHETALRIRSRAALIDALRHTGVADESICKELENAIKSRSLHVDGAWHGLDGSTAVNSLAAIRPDAHTVNLLSQTAELIDPRLKEVEQRKELPWWLRRKGAWWDFRIKTESIAALGKIGGAEARKSLWRMLEQQPADAQAKWRELHWDAARALTGGAWRLTTTELERLLAHESTGAQRAACVYLLRFQDRDEYQGHVQRHLPWAEKRCQDSF